MGIYSTYDVYPSYFDEEYECDKTNCHDCIFDCKYNHNKKYYSGDDDDE